MSGFEIDASLLAPDVGLPDDAALTEFLLRLNTDPRGEMVPSSGWRVPHDSGELVTAAAYDAAYPGWTVVSIRRIRGEYAWSGASYGVSPRATASDRGRDFGLRFATDDFEMLTGDAPTVRVVVMNGSAETYVGTSHFALGRVRLLGATSWDTGGGGWFGYAPLTHIEIPGGESVEVPVVFTRHDFAPGEYEIGVVVADLALAVEGARLHVRSP